MRVRAEEIRSGSVLRSRVCVVGAGPAGLSLASSLAEAGIDVLLLEAADGGLPREELETVSTTGLVYEVPEKRGRGVGGGSLEWNIRTPLGEPYVRLRELDDLDLERRPGVRDVGWPLSKTDLAGAYREAWALFGLPPSDPADDAADDGDTAVRLFRMGPAATFSERLPQVLAVHPRVRVVTGANVTEVLTDGDLGTVSALRVASPAGEITVEADVHVLAGGAIENARLLLASRSRSADGLGNASDHVGRWFMEHPHYDAGVVLPADRRLEEHPDLWNIHVRDGLAVQRKYAPTREATEREGLLDTAFFLRTRSPRDAVLTTADGELDAKRTTAFREWRLSLGRRDVRAMATATSADVLTALPAASRYLLAQSRARQAARGGRRAGAPPRNMSLRGMAEQVPNPLSRVTLTSTRDRFGMPTAQLDWRLTDADWDSMARSTAAVLPRLRTVFGGSVLSLLDGGPTPVVGGAHQMGTTRMAASPRDGVVDPACRVHGTSNLYVAGASVFPTVGSANPTLTAVAVALRLAAHLRSQLGAPLTDVLTGPRAARDL